MRAHDKKKSSFLEEFIMYRGTGHDGTPKPSVTSAVMFIRIPNKMRVKFDSLRQQRPQHNWAHLYGSQALFFHSRDIR